MRRGKNRAALLLMLGLTVGGNGVVMAAEPGTETAAKMQQEAGTAEKESDAPAGTAQGDKQEESSSAAEPDQAPAAGGEEKNDGGAESDVSRIVSFTDYTGMLVTYDASVSRHYVYEVEDGVLKSVAWKNIGADGGKTLETVAFEGNVELKQPEEGEKYTAVAADVFGGNELITYVKLPVGVTSVAEGGFKGCTALKSVYLPSTVNEIGDGAFEGCTSMTQISLPKALRAIGNHAFKGDISLRVVQIKDMESCELSAIGERAFAGCAALEEFYTESAMPPKLESVGKAAFEGCTKLENK